MIVMKYGVVIEKSADGYGAYVPDLPACAVVGDTVEETKSLIETAIALHIRIMRADGDPMPQPTTIVDYVEVAESPIPHELTKAHLALACPDTSSRHERQMSNDPCRIKLTSQTTH
jgi:predicted RNase H-like HicB family nuclease